MHLGELKAKPIDELLSIAGEMGIENIARSKKQDVIFSILKKHSKSGEDIEGEGVLEILNDGFGFLRSPTGSCLLYTSPSPRDGIGSRMPSSA